MQQRIFLPTQMSGARPKLFLHPAARALALFLGGFSLLNLLGNFRSAGFDANLWWIDLRVLPALPAQLFLLLSSLCLVGFSIRPPRSPWRRGLTTVVVSLLVTTVFWNIVEFYALLARRELHTLLPLPLSLLILTTLILILRANARVATTPSPGGLKNFCGIVALCLVCLAAFPVAQMVCFGKTDYRRSGDVAVVFGARAYKDGRPSDALADRVKTACQLYRDGMVKKLIFSGGPGDGAVTECESMRRMAFGLGVQPNDILTDDAGLNTQATVKNTEALFAKLDAHKILVVSHFYHLPRVKLAYHRAGWEVYTVPAKESYFLGKTPYFVAREVAALWVYYLRPLA